MGAFLRRVDALHDGVQKDVLKLLLFLGGQRPMQLLRSGLVRQISAEIFKTVTSAALLDVAFVEYRHAIRDTRERVERLTTLVRFVRRDWKVKAGL
jgi:hypothetical protein